MTLISVLPGSETRSEIVLRAENLRVYYGDRLAVRDVTIGIPKNDIVAFIGPSGCGKTSILRSFNRLNELIPGARVGGNLSYRGQDINDPHWDVMDIRCRIGMVFQKPNPFPLSIYENVAFGARINGYGGDMDELVEQSLQQVILWDEVKDKLDENGLNLSGGQQQRLCIARAIAIQPEVILMDEPCSCLDPIATLRVEELFHHLKQTYTLVIATHNMQQAARISNLTAFFNVEPTPTGENVGYLVEYDRTSKIFQNPAHPITHDYVSGRFG